MVRTSLARMTRLVGKTPGLFVMTVLLMGSQGCANRPYIQRAPTASWATTEDPSSVIETNPNSTIIIVEPTDPNAPAPDVVVRQGPPPADGWTPTALPTTNPFERHRTWVGDYDCTQGNTGFALRIMDVRGRVVRAIFDFIHEDSGAQGSYVITGHYDPETRRVHFEPSRWIVQPNDYVMVPMSGEISGDESLFAGKIDFRGCGAFKLKPTR